VRFASEGYAIIRADEARVCLAGVVNRVLERLAESKLPKTPLAEEWEHLARRFQRRRGRAVATRVAGVFPLVAVIFFGAATTALVFLNISGAARVGRTLMLACLAVADGYAARMWRTRQHQRRTA
jgi:hypothetical protein